MGILRISGSGASFLPISFPVIVLLASLLFGLGVVPDFLLLLGDDLVLDILLGSLILHSLRYILIAVPFVVLVVD